MDIGSYFQFVLALAFVIGLILLAALAARRMGWGFPVQAMKRLDDRRLRIIEATPVDGRRRLVLVRRDDTEHLLLLGPSSEVVVERGIHHMTDFRQALDTVATPRS